VKEVFGVSHEHLSLPTHVSSEYKLYSLYVLSTMCVYNNNHIVFFHKLS